MLEHRDQSGADQRTPDLAGATDHGHEQVFDADVKTEGRRIDEALKVRVEPARNGGEPGRNQKDDHFRARGIDTHRLGHHTAALERADGPSLAGIEQVLRRPNRAQHNRPNKVVEIAPILEVESKQAQRRNPGNPRVTAKKGNIAE